MGAEGAQISFFAPKIISAQRPVVYKKLYFMGKLRVKLENAKIKSISVSNLHLTFEFQEDRSRNNNNKKLCM